jgi:hypothetical protein
MAPNAPDLDRATISPRIVVSLWRRGDGVTAADFSTVNPPLPFA